MREIKFRMWYDGNMFMPDIETEFANIIYCVPRIQADNDEERAKAHIMQYTGLKEKNGKEWYFGDIIKYKYWDANKPHWRDLAHKTEIEEMVKEQKKDIKEYTGVIELSNFCPQIISALHYFYLHELTHDLKVYKSGEFIGGSYQSEYFDFEVIGNIHENPELLEK